MFSLLGRGVLSVVGEKKSDGAAAGCSADPHTLQCLTRSD